MAKKKTTRRLAAILAADMVGYASLMEADEEGAIARQRRHQTDLIDPLIRQMGGRVVKTTGDGLLVEFPSAVDAVNCAVQLQQAVAEREADEPDGRRIQYRIGVNLGDIVVEDDDIFGDGVNVAARLETLAKPGGVCLSDAVRQEVEGRLPLQLQDIGKQKVKNRAKEVHAHYAAATPAAKDAKNTPEPALVALEIPDIPSIAVLPFKSLSRDLEGETFADGIVEDIITALSRLKRLLVIARSSTESYASEERDLKQVSKELGVRYVLEGAVRRSGTRIRITVQLTDAMTGKNLWGGRFDGALGDLFDLQDEITDRIVNELEPELLRAEIGRLRSKKSVDLGAWALAIRGRATLWQWTRASLAEGEALARKAINADPDFVDGYALLSIILAGQAISGFVDDGAGAMAEAAQVAARAVSLDENSAHAHAALGFALIGSGRYDEAQAEADRALELLPGSSEILIMTSLCCLYCGAAEDAIARAEASVRLNPRAPDLYGRYQAMAAAKYVLGQYEDSLADATRVIRTIPEWLEARTFQIACLVALDRMDEAAVALAAAKAANPRYSPDYVLRRHPFRDKDKTKALVDAIRLAEEMP